MDPKNKRKPIPAGGQPTSATIEAADATPPATTTSAAESQADAATSQPDQGQASPPAETGTPAADVAGEQPTPTPPAENEPQQDDAPVVDQDEIVDARVLVAFDEHDVDDIVSAPARAIEQLKLAGRVDPHPDAVAFARELLA